MTTWKELYWIFHAYDAEAHKRGHHSTFAVPTVGNKPKIEITDLDDLISIGPQVRILNHSNIHFEKGVRQKLPYGANAYFIVTTLNNAPDKIVQYYHFDDSRYFLEIINRNMENINHNLNRKVEHKLNCELEDRLK